MIAAITTLLVVAASHNAEAQISIPFQTHTYHVEVQKQRVHLGAGGTTTFWQSVFESEDRAEAELVYQIMLEAFEDGDLEYLNSYGTTVFTVVIGIRFRVETTINANILATPSYLQNVRNAKLLKRSW